MNSKLSCAPPAAASVHLGYEALIRRYSLRVPSLRTVYCGVDRAVERRITATEGTERIELPLLRLTDTDSLVGQLTFALKREPLNLCVLGALFEREDVLQGIQAWLEAKPSSKYARIAGHLAEWLTDYRFHYQLPAGVPRVPLLDPRRYVPGPSVPNPRFGVTHNLVGTPAFSPLIRRTDKLDALLAEDLGSQISAALGRLEPELLARAIDYLYLSETRSTYGLEDEIPDNNRAARFRRLLEQAGEPGGLTEEQVMLWHAEIVESLRFESAYRNGQNWLSRFGHPRNLADFIPPPATLVEPMMDGVAEVAGMASARTLHPVLAAACAAFGLVFVHPLWDGNGRLHRFLLHHVLRQSGFTPAGMVLPISARMLKDLPRYAALLKSYSRPPTELLEYRLDADSDSIHVTSPQPRWLYACFDATELCEFVLECVKGCVDEDLQEEVAYLRAHDATVRDLEIWLDMRQSQLNLLIAAIVDGHGKLPEHKRKLAAPLSNDQVVLIESTTCCHFADYLRRRIAEK
ncbi:Fic family protein [Derxia lacustris]|uniref:Fic family protein n=1 Tax=Derxia lacustris TaxID=764842 RepID=UPI000A16F10C|nr:Fic family protein [Derxia lacustris]